ncbi:MAG: alpha/beta hydrolase-fold protein [Bacteroidetes bacterium]|nr:alpha/beta hydrolase-fold protein [Bacteroidota bacterium]
MKKLLILLSVTTFLHLAHAQDFRSFINQVNAITDTTLKMAAVDSFMTIITPMGIPYIQADTVNFIYRGSAGFVQVPGDFNGWTSQDDPMTLLEGTDFWYLSKYFEMNARLDYKFIIDGNTWILDPLNPHEIWGGYGPNSELAMPGYIQPWEINLNPGINHGTLDTIAFLSSHTGYNYQIIIYLPFGYDPLATGGYPAVYFQDGFEYISLGSANTVIDNLIEGNYIDKIIGVFVRPYNRNEEYAGNKRNQYRMFFTEELVPYIDEHYNTMASPGGRAVIGDSYGGNISALISYYHPDIFGNCGLHSGAFWPNNYEAYNAITQGLKVNVRWAAIWGSYESLFENMRNFRDFLLGENYLLTWKELPEGHSWGLWRATIDDIIIFFYPKGWSGLPHENLNRPLSVTVTPNPFSGSCALEFEGLPDDTWQLNIFDSLGKMVPVEPRVIQSGHMITLQVQAGTLPDTVCFYRLQSGDRVASGKLIKIK